MPDLSSIVQFLPDKPEFFPHMLSAPEAHYRVAWSDVSGFECGLYLFSFEEGLHVLAPSRGVIISYMAIFITSARSSCNSRIVGAGIGNGCDHPSQWGQRAKDHR